MIEIYLVAGLMDGRQRITGGMEPVFIPLIPTFNFLKYFENI